jgi:hypothetical protein
MAKSQQQTVTYKGPTGSKRDGHSVQVNVGGAEYLFRQGVESEPVDAEVVTALEGLTGHSFDYGKASAAE